MGQIKIATWNVNSIRARQERLSEWLETEQPDIVALQETKTLDDSFPAEDLRNLGYYSLFCGQKTYNGVALLSRQPLAEAQYCFDAEFTQQKRFIAATFLLDTGEPVRVVCCYVPNGQAVDSDKYAYKLDWLNALKTWLAAEKSRYAHWIVLGDFNIAPQDQDVHDPAAWAGKVLCSEPERQAFKQILDLGFWDAFRLFEQPEKIWSWWDYRRLAFQKNAGLRIDLILISEALRTWCQCCDVHRDTRKKARPSDHAPVVLSLKNPSA